MELEFNRCPALDKELKDWANIYPFIKTVIFTDPSLYDGGEQACFEWKAGELAKLKDVILYEDKEGNTKHGIPLREHIDYVFPVENILQIMDGYAGGTWVSEAPDKLKERREKQIKKKVQEARDYEERELAYVNNIKRDWKLYEVPTADQGDYTIRNVGIFKTVITINPETNQPQYITKEVCRTPFVLCGVSESLKDDEVYYKIRYPTYTGEVKEFWASQSTLLSKKELKTLFLSKGINCPENSILFETVDYISRSIAEFSPRYKKEYSTNQCGWNADLSLFVLGNRGISTRGIEPILSVGSGKGFPELEKKGTIQGWVEGVSPHMVYDVVRFKCYDVMTAILNRALGLESHTTDHYGNTSVGKTFTWWLALSMVGDAEGLTVGAKGTIKGILTTVKDFSDLPILVDESSDAGDHLAELVYPLTSNKGRVKSTVDGKRDGGEEYHTTTVFTGERPIRDCLKNSGQQYRVNELDDSLPDLPTKEITRVTRAIRKNRGLVVELFIQDVLKKIESGALQTLYDECFDKLPQNTSNIEGRSRSIFAGIMAAGEILEPIFGKIGIPQKDPAVIVDKYFHKCILEKPVELEYIRALRLVLDWINSDYGAFARFNAGYTEVQVIDKNKTYGFVDENCIDILQSEFSAKMKREGFSPTKIKEDWYKQGISISNDPKRPGTYRTSKKGYGPYASIRIDRAIAGNLVGYDIDEVKKDDDEETTFSQFEKVNLILDLISLLTRAHGIAEIQYIRSILTFNELDEYLQILTKTGKIIKISQTEYKPAK